MHLNSKTVTPAKHTYLFNGSLILLVLLFSGCINSSVDNANLNPLPKTNVQEPPTQTNPPPAPTIITGLKSINSGADHNCAIKNADDSLWCWGKNNVGQLGNGTLTNRTTFSSVTNEGEWKEISNGQLHTCGIKKTSNALLCWGESTAALGNPSLFRVLNPDATISDGSWVSVSAGGDHSCGIKQNGTDKELWCWGNNDQSQLGAPDPDLTAPDTEIRQVGIETDWLSISSGYQFSCGIRNDITTGQELWCWGVNNRGQLGNGTTVALPTVPALPDTVPALTPGKIGADLDWVSVSTGYAHACGIRNTDELYCWGGNSYGQLGHSLTADTDTPTKIIVNDNGVMDIPWATVSTGQYHSCAIDASADSNLWCWGNNSSGQIGIGSTAHQSHPVKIGSGWSSVSAGDNHSCAIDKDNIGHCWGLNLNGQLANSINTASSLPRVLDESTNWDSINAGRLHTCGIKIENSVRSLWCGGSNIYGQLGNNTIQSQASPTLVPPSNSSLEWVSVASSHHHTCAIDNAATTTGGLYCWGKNDDGQLGDGTTTNKPANWTPVQVETDTDWTTVVTGANHTCGIKATNELWCWGNNSSYQLGNNTNINSSVPIQVFKNPTTAPTPLLVLSVAIGGLPGNASNGHSCAIQTDNTLWCWGANDMRQTGDFQTNNTLITPIKIPAQTKISSLIGADNDWQTIKAGNSYTCATKTDKTLWCWGNQDASNSILQQRNTPTALILPAETPIDTWSDFDIGDKHACATNTGGDMWCWGDNNEKQLTNNATGDEIDLPRLVQANGDWKSLAMGQKHGCGIRENTDGERLAYCWGSTSLFQLGDDQAWKTTPQRLTLE